MKHRRRSTLKRKTRGKRHCKTHYRRKSVRRMKGGTKGDIVIPFQVMLQQYFKNKHLSENDKKLLAPFEFDQRGNILDLKPNAHKSQMVPDDDDYYADLSEGREDKEKLDEWYQIPFTHTAQKDNDARKLLFKDVAKQVHYGTGYDKIFPPNSGISLGDNYSKGSYDGEHIYFLKKAH